MSRTYNYNKEFHEDLDVLGLGNRADAPYSDNELYEAYQAKVNDAISEAEADHAYAAYFHLKESGREGANKTGTYHWTILPEIFAVIVVSLILPGFAFTGDSALKKKMDKEEKHSYGRTLREAEKENAFKMGIGTTKEYGHALFLATCNRFLFRIPISTFFAWLGFQAFSYSQSGNIENPFVWVLMIVLALYLFLEAIVNLSPMGLLAIPANIGERKYNDILVEGYLSYTENRVNDYNKKQLKEKLERFTR